MPITLNGSTSGQVTIDAPAVAGTTALTLPASSGTIATTGDIPTGYTDADALSLFNASGSAPVYACRAWVDFNGTGTVSINGSGNVTGITDNGTGDYTINFTTSMQDANYAHVSFTDPSIAALNNTTVLPNQVSKTTAALQLRTNASNGAAQDAEVVCVSIFR